MGELKKSFNPSIQKIPNMVFASLYPTMMRDLYDERIRLKIRKKKLDKILDNIINYGN